MWRLQRRYSLPVVLQQLFYVGEKSRVCLFSVVMPRIAAEMRGCTKQTFAALAQSTRMKMSLSEPREFLSCEWWALAHVRKTKPIDLIAINSSDIGESYAVWHNSLKIVLAMLQAIRHFKKEMGTDRYSVQIQSRGTVESPRNTASCQEAGAFFYLPRKP